MGKIHHWAYIWYRHIRYNFVWDKRTCICALDIRIYVSAELRVCCRWVTYKVPDLKQLQLYEYFNRIARAIVRANNLVSIQYTFVDLLRIRCCNDMLYTHDNFYRLLSLTSLILKLLNWSLLYQRFTTLIGDRKIVRPLYGLLGTMRTISTWVLENLNIPKYFNYPDNKVIFAAFYMNKFTAHTHTLIRLINELLLKVQADWTWWPDQWHDNIAKTPFDEWWAIKRIVFCYHVGCSKWIMLLFFMHIIFFMI